MPIQIKETRASFVYCIGADCFGFTLILYRTILVVRICRRYVRNPRSVRENAIRDSHYVYRLPPLSVAYVPSLIVVVVALGIPFWLLLRYPTPFAC